MIKLLTNLKKYDNFVVFFLFIDIINSDKRIMIKNKKG